ncbi:MAG: hypothetical protein NG740_05965 [Omnitrophica bacterium]|nr:hypothetical protein [Candidatus Omnitrophota bacterium]
MTIDRVTRQNSVLEAIVKAHVETALPVGSKHISRMLDLSSATIRGVMFDLERAGYIKQPHISAGRIPTDLGYRRYVDNILSYAEFVQNDIFSQVRQILSEQKLYEDLIEAASSAISRITNYTGIALLPNNRLYFDGAHRILEQPEFMELDTARDFLRVVEERGELVEILNRDLKQRGTAIHIGRENAFEELSECTIITATYKYKNQVSGNVGVIGPMRMKYEEVVPMVEFFAKMTTDFLEELSV